MWKIHGKTYDLTPFIEKHPGGAEILIQTRGLGDCSALFESYHAFSDRESIMGILQKYEIVGVEETTTTRYDFASYRELSDRVHSILPSRESIKATKSWCFLNTFTFGVYMSILYFMVMSQDIIVKCFCATFVGLLESSITFNILHDSSHYAISVYPKANNLIGDFIQSWFLWNHRIWFYHHVYAHHSFTGSNNDPDHGLYNFTNNGHIINAICLVLPGQYLLQVFSYILTSITRNYSNVSGNKMMIPSDIHIFSYLSIFVMLFKLGILCNSGIMSILCYSIVINGLYYINVFGDHDFYETKIDNHYDGPDWAKRQIYNSGNFMNDSIIWTYVFSGINYQIEHHLFPNMCGHLYPSISPIVKDFCKERGWPYVHHPTFYSSYLSFMKRVRHKNA
jgi:fatty acid desaturase